MTDTLTQTSSTTAAPRSATQTTTATLVIRDLHVVPIADRSHEILRGINLDRPPGRGPRDHGPQRLGKTTLAYALMGHPAYLVTTGEVIWKGRDLLKLSAGQAQPAGHLPRLPVPDRDPRPERGQLPAHGAQCARAARLDRRPTPRSTRPTPPAAASAWATTAACCARRWRCSSSTMRSPARYVNEGFSGGEKKRLEMLQMAVLRPRDGHPRRDRPRPGHRRAAHRRRGRQRPAQSRPWRAADHPLPAPAQLHHAGHVHVLAQGQIVASGGRELALRLEEEGYAPVLREAGLEAPTTSRAARTARSTAPHEQRS